jgi:hypothetical protein
VKIRLLLAAFAAVGLVSGGQAVLAASASAASARPAASSTVTLDVVSCTGNSFCLASGFVRGEGVAPLAEVWNGKTWRIIPNPPGFGGEITCSGLTFCLAATFKGRSQVELAWNGKTWRRFSPQPPPGNFTCLTPKFCLGITSLASGVNVEVYWTGGTSWPEMPGTNAGCGGAWCGVTQFSCGSTTNCFDEGSYCGDSDCDSGTFDYTDVWNGITWTDRTSAGPDFTGPESCAGRSFCMILDSPKQAAVSNNWSKTWQSAATHLAASCRLANCTFTGSAVPVCASPHFCLALPSQNPLGILIWNGTKWGVSKLALIGGHRPKITGLACGTPTNCMASGTYQRAPRATPQPEFEHWNGKTWTVTPIKKP